MATDVGALQHELEQLLEVERFPPPSGFRQSAAVTDASIYRRADADHEAFWAKQAQALHWDQPSERKIIRRPLPDVAEGRELGDVTTLRDASFIEQLTGAVKAHQPDVG